MESFISEWGLAAVFLFGFLEAACVPIPSEITFGFAGVLAYQGHFNIVLVILIGTIAELIGSFLSYYVGRIGGRPLVERFGRYLLISSADLDRAERFFVGRGAFAVPLGRALPIVRTFISLVAGLVKMPAGLFGVLSLVGTAVWVTVISLVGYGLGSAWQSIAHGIAVVVVLAVAAFITHRVRELRKESAARLDSLPLPGAAGGLGSGAVPGSGAVRDDAARKTPGHRKVGGPST